MSSSSAGLLLFRHRSGHLELLLVHPGGPFWAKRDLGAWSIPKGELAVSEDALAAAEREFIEELGSPPQVTGPALRLDPVRQRGGKLVHAWAREGDFDVTKHKSNTFELEWPPRSGRMQSFAEVDRAAWFTVQQARLQIIDGQRPLIDQLQQCLAGVTDRH